MLPNQPDHPRAADQYFKLELGDLQTLETPIANTRQPRLTFLYTTLDRLLAAADISDLWLREVARQKLYAVIRERGLAVECWYPVAMGDRPEADLALLGPQGRLTLYIDEPAWDDLDEPRPVYAAAHHLNALELLRDPVAALDRLLAGGGGEETA